MSKKTYRILIPILTAVLVGTLFSFILRHYLVPENEAYPSNTSTQALFAAQFPDSAGKMQPLQQWRGKVLIVNFWATWCPPCREEMPELSALAETYRARNVVVIGISTDDLKKIQGFSAANPVSYPLLAGDMAAMSLSEQLGNSKGALPYTLIVNADGSMANTYFGRVNQALLEKTLIPLLTHP